MSTETTDPQRRLWEPGIAGLIGHLADVTRPDAAELPEPSAIDAPDDGPYAALYRRWGELRGPLAQAGFPTEGDLMCVGAAEWGHATAEYEMAVLDGEAPSVPLPPESFITEVYWPHQGADARVRIIVGGVSVSVDAAEIPGLLAALRSSAEVAALVAASG